MAVIRRPVPPGIDPVWLARQLARFRPEHAAGAVQLIRAYERADREKAIRERQGSAA